VAYQRVALRVIESSEFVGTPEGDALIRNSLKLHHYRHASHLAPRTANSYHQVFTVG
jgi:hypothetical protein